MRLKAVILISTLSAAAILVADNSAKTPTPASAKKAATATGPVTASASTFEQSVQPILSKTCTPCHNDRLASGGLNLTPFSTLSSISEHRDDWERILQKIRTGEMPPKGMPRPPTTHRSMP